MGPQPRQSGAPSLRPGDEQAGLWATIKAVAWSFFGVRRRQDHEADFAKLNPLHVVIVGVLMGVLFVLTLVTIVRLIV